MGEVVLRSRYRRNCSSPNRDLLPLSSVEMAVVWMVIRAARKTVSRLDHVGSAVYLAVSLHSRPDAIAPALDHGPSHSRILGDIAVF